MKAHVPSYNLHTPNDLGAALKMLQDNPSWKALAGGTDLMVLFEAGHLPEGEYVSLLKLSELRGIESDDDFITFGALTTYSEVRDNQICRNEFPMLVDAAAVTGSIAIQNRGTLGGNIVNASPAADSPPALLAYDADIELTGPKGSRWIGYDTFHTGYKAMTIEPGELLTRIRVPRKTVGTLQHYRKIGTRKAQAISKVCFAALVRPEGKGLKEARIAMGSVAPVPLRCVQTENVLTSRSFDSSLIDEAVKTFTQEIAPIDDIRSTQKYRTHVSANVLRSFLGHVELDG